ncbi:hypothetical protein HOY82DRAFT_553968, partial [Tuber indicum]
MCTKRSVRIDPSTFLSTRFFLLMSLLSILILILAPSHCGKNRFRIGLVSTSFFFSFSSILLIQTKEPSPKPFFGTIHTLILRQL